MGLIDWIKLITPVGWSIIVMSILIGIGLGYFLNKRFPNLFSQDKKMKKVLNNPHLLVEKLKANGDVYDHFEDGKRKKLNFSVGTNAEGKEIVVIEAPFQKRLKKKLRKRLKLKKTETKKGKAKSKKTTKKGNK